jgi:hypothetical protein
LELRRFERPHSARWAIPIDLGKSNPFDKMKEGKTSRHIAQISGLSPSTVDKHLRQARSREPYRAAVFAGKTRKISDVYKQISPKQKAIIRQTSAANETVLDRRFARMIHVLTRGQRGSSLLLFVFLALHSSVSDGTTKAVDRKREVLVVRNSASSCAYV